MKPVAILQHDHCNFPAYFGEFLATRNIPARHFRLDLGDPVPIDLHDYSGLGLMGGVMSVADDHLHPYLTEELRLIRHAHDSGVPVIGHCLGGQLISKALGGRVTPSPTHEIGWHVLERTSHETTAQWLGADVGNITVFQWHTETFSLPQDATLLLTSEHCRHQAFLAGNCLALQAHVEVTPSVITGWLDEVGHTLTPPSASVQSRERILDGIDTDLPAVRKLADHLYSRWLALF